MKMKEKVIKLFYTQISSDPQEELMELLGEFAPSTVDDITEDEAKVIYKHIKDCVNEGLEIQGENPIPMLRFLDLGFEFEVFSDGYRQAEIIEKQVNMLLEEIPITSETITPWITYVRTLKTTFDILNQVCMDMIADKIKADQEAKRGKN